MEHTEDTRALDDKALDDRVEVALQLAQHTPGMRIAIHGLPEQQLLDWRDRQDRRLHAMVTPHGDAPTDATVSIIVEQALEYSVILYALPGPYAESIARIEADERELAAASR